MMKDTAEESSYTYKEENVLWIMSPTEGERDILFFMRILLAPALALALASAWHFLVCTISYEPVGGF